MGLLNRLSTTQKDIKNRPIQTADEFQALFTDNPEAIFILNYEGNVTSLNQKLTALLGYKMKDKSLFEKKFFQSRYEEKVRNHFQQAKQGLTTYFEMAVNHIAGHELPIQITFIPSEKFIFSLCKDLTNVKSIEKEISHISHQLEDSQRLTNIGNWEYDIKSNKAYWSNQMYEIMGIQQGEVELDWERVLKSVHPQDHWIYQENFQKALDEKIDLDFEHRIIRGDGSERVVFIRTNVILDDKGEVTRIFGTIQDITDQKELETKLEESEERFKSVSDRLPVGIWSYDVIDDRVTFSSKGIEKILGAGQAKFEEATDLWKNMILQEDREMVEKKQLLLANGEEIHFQYRILDENGKIKWLECKTIPYLDQDGKVTRLDGIIRDFTERKNYLEHLSFLADHDYLTELPNRRYIERKLQEFIQAPFENGKQFAVLYLDLDRFKYVNDTLGHEIGDRFLVSFSVRMKEYLGSETFIARIGGDEFIIILNDITGLENAIQLANNIIAEVEKPFYIDEFELFITTSIGISMYPMDGDNPNELLKNADTALYKAKESGRNDWQVFSPSMNIESFKIYQLERDLRKSLTNEELFVHYQPKVNPKTSKIMGAEALVRWNHPEWGIVSPGEFIPLAEENGFIFKMGDWVLKEVCETLAFWIKRDVPVVPVSVNVSPKRLLKTGFVKMVQQTILEAGIDPSLIELELTEQTIIKNTEATKIIITELKALGVKIALDDFGTGYSSLSYLKDLDIDTLKIDKSFIDGITVNSMNDAIVKSLIFLTKEVDISIVAEGVETKEQLTFLLQQECQLIQGYIYSKAVSNMKFEALLKKEVIQPLQPSSLTKVIENRRKYFRVKLDYPLTADMTIVKFKNKDINLGSSKVIIEDISLGGLKYTANLNLPIQSDMIIQFNTVILGKELQFVGKNVWKLEIDDLYEYGFECIFSEVERDRFALIFNKILIQLKESSILPDSSVLQKNKLSYLKGLK